ncbi:MAG: D-alanyl-D-alanine carboxypeptidase/D-alanyl-D-alanine-endopeptidase [Candidatus Kryptoniota bacterium]
MRTVSKFCTLFIFFFASFLASGRTKETKSQSLLKHEINFIIQASKTPRTIKAVEIYSRKNKKILFQANSQLLLRPASNLKIITTSFALQNLGGGYNFKTGFLISGTRHGNTIDGNLIVSTCGDPIITHADLDSVAGIISQNGIETINGNLVIDVSEFDSLQWGAGWMWDDEPGDYQMFISPACLDHNTITVDVSLDSINNRLSITLKPQTGFVRFLSTAVADTLDSLFVTRIMNDDTNTILVSGKYSGHLHPYEDDFSVRHPAHYFGTVFKEMLGKHGIEVHGEVLTEPRDRKQETRNATVTLFTLEHSIDTVITYINKVSDNLGAECLLRKVPNEICGQIGSADNGITLEGNFLRQCGVDSTEFYIADGSGLSHYDLITPAAIVKVLSYDLTQPTDGPNVGSGDIFFHSLPLAGKDGTLEKRMCQEFVTGKVIAKTGSISGVSTLSGYVLLPKDTLVFSMMMQNFIASGDTMRALQDSLCSVLVLYNDNYRTFARNLRHHDIGTYRAIHRKHPKQEHEPHRRIKRRKHSRTGD